MFALQCLLAENDNDGIAPVANVLLDGAVEKGGGIGCGIRGLGGEEGGGDGNGAASEGLLGVQAVGDSWLPFDGSNERMDSLILGLGNDSLLNISGRDASLGLTGGVRFDGIILLCGTSSIFVHYDEGWYFIIIQHDSLLGRAFRFRLPPLARYPFSPFNS